MSSGVNKAILIGNVGKDPEVKHTKSGSSVAKISLATAESWKDASGNKQEKTEWHNVVFFGRLAEIVGSYLKKGSKVYIEGSIRTDKYEKDGVTKYSTSIIGKEMRMLDSRDQASQGYNANSSPAQLAGNTNNQTEPYSYDDEDIPF